MKNENTYHIDCIQMTRDIRDKLMDEHRNLSLFDYAFALSQEAENGEFSEYLKSKSETRK